MAYIAASNDQDHAHGKIEWRGIDASKHAVGDDSNVIRLNASHASHGEAQVTIHLQVASQGAGVVNVHSSDMVMC
jgi:hypothetical protein